jgi:hypothetical protein
MTRGYIRPTEAEPGFVTAIILDGNSQTGFHQLMSTAAVA